MYLHIFNYVNYIKYIYIKEIFSRIFTVYEYILKLQTKTYIRHKLYYSNIVSSLQVSGVEFEVNAWSQDKHALGPRFNILVAIQDKQNSFVEGQTCVKRVSVSLASSLGYTLALTSLTNIFLFSHDHYQLDGRLDIFQMFAVITFFPV